MKKYENPMLQVVSINKKDIIATSEVSVYIGETNTADRSAGRRGIFDPYDPYDAGY